MRRANLQGIAARHVQRGGEVRTHLRRRRRVLFLRRRREIVVTPQRDLERTAARMHGAHGRDRAHARRRSRAHERISRERGGPAGRSARGTDDEVARNGAGGPCRESPFERAARYLERHRGADGDRQRGERDADPFRHSAERSGRELRGCRRALRPASCGAPHEPEQPGYQERSAGREAEREAKNERCGG